VQQWRLWHLMVMDHRRVATALRAFEHGDLWLTLSLGISIAIIGVTWALLWNLPLAEMLLFPA
jgi:hypothetical protein